VGKLLKKIKSDENVEQEGSLVSILLFYLRTLKHQWRGLKITMYMDTKVILHIMLYMHMWKKSAFWSFIFCGNMF